jgi:hypothetical protein
MKRTRKVRPSVEILETRDMPSATVLMLNGSLVVRGTTPTVSIQALSNTQYSITHDGVTETVSGVTGDVRVNLSLDTNADNVTIDLQGYRVGHDVVVRTGSGNDTVTVKNGTVAHDIQIITNAGADTVTIGDGTTNLTVNDDVNVNDGARPADSLTVKKGVTIQHNLVNAAGNQLMLEQGAQVANGLIFYGGLNGYNVTIAGSVGGSVWFFGTTRSGATANFTLTSTGTIGQNLVAYTTSAWPYYAGSTDVFELDGHIGNSLYIQTYGASDTVTFDVDLAIGGTAYVLLGYGNDTFNYNTPFSRPITAYIDGGYGFNTFNGDSNRPATVTRSRFQTINP